MPTNVGILPFMSRINFMLNWVEHEKKCYNLGARSYSFIFRSLALVDNSCLFPLKNGYVYAPTTKATWSWHFFIILWYYLKSISPFLSTSRTIITLSSSRSDKGHLILYKIDIRLISCKAIKAWHMSHVETSYQLLAAKSITSIGDFNTYSIEKHPREEVLLLKQPWWSQPKIGTRHWPAKESSWFSLYCAIEGETLNIHC